MTIEFLETGFDILIAVLLVATIVYAVILNRKLDALRVAKAEMETLMRGFTETTLKAERSLSELKMHAAEAGSGLQGQITQSEAVLNDLRLLTGKGESVCDRLQSALSGAPAPARSGPESGPETGADLVKSLARGVAQRHPAGESPEPTAPSQRAPDRDKSSGGQAGGEKLSPAAADLLKALKGMR